MAIKYRKDLKLLVHPFLFVLKEGRKIQDNFLDYSLLMLQVVSPEILKSPPDQEKSSKTSEVLDCDFMTTGETIPSLKF
jgi:hypothetical protein